MRWYAQDEVNQEESEQNEVDGMKKGADSTGKVMHVWKSGWWFVMRKIRVIEHGFTSALKHNIGYTADGFYRSDDPTNSVKALKEGG